ncbi:MAG: hypothetical protein LAQ69_16580 [Acidobacteriia bacterium]|nr:hypothetical protein [Terriglobia bacterium]
MLIEKIAGLSLEERSRIEKRLSERIQASGAGSVGGLPDLRPIPRDKVRRKRSELQLIAGTEAPPGGDEDVYVFPPSFDQERLFFIELYDPGNAYNVPMPVPFAQSVSVPALARALRELGARHEILRTTFGFLERRPVQVVSLESGLTLDVTDLRGTPPQRRSFEVLRTSARYSRVRFDLLRGPLLKANLLRLADDDHLLLLNMHHTITDLWSAGLIVNELTELYQAFSQGRAPSLPDLPLQFGDYAVWQRETLDGDAIDRRLSYWRQALAGAPQVLELPTDRARPKVQSTRGETWLFPLGAKLTTGLAALHQSRRCTLFHALVAALGALLGHYADTADLLIGTPMSNRIRPGLEMLIGMFVNSVALRVRPKPALTFDELLRQVQSTTLDAFDHQDLPFGVLIEELLEERNPSRSPLFQVMIAHQNEPSTIQMFASSLPEDIGEGLPVQGGTGSAKFDLVLGVMETARGLLATWEYNTDLFEESTIRRWGRRYRQVLEAAVADPRVTVGELRRRIAEWDRSELGPNERPKASRSSSEPPTAAPVRNMAEVEPARVAHFAGTTAAAEEIESLSNQSVDRLLEVLLERLPEETVQREIDTVSAGEPGLGLPAAPLDAGLANELLLARLDELTDVEVEDRLLSILSEPA